jgi:RNA polymerase sigma factor for flagellar operon FliA
VISPELSARLAAFLETREDAHRAAVIEGFSYLVPLTLARVLPPETGSLAREDFDQIGAMALIEAVDRFDPAKGCRFESFAIGRIRARVIDALRSEDFLSRAARRRARAVEAERERGFTPAEIASRLDLSEAQVQASLGHYTLAPFAPLEEIHGDEADPAAILEAGERFAALHDAIAMLPDEEREAITALYLEGHSAGDLARAWRCSIAEISGIERRALDRLRAFLPASLYLP